MAEFRFPDAVPDAVATPVENTLAPAVNMINRPFQDTIGNAISRVLGTGTGALVVRHGAVGAVAGGLSGYLVTMLAGERNTANVPGGGAASRTVGTLFDALGITTLEQVLIASMYGAATGAGSGEFSFCKRNAAATSNGTPSPAANQRRCWDLLFGSLAGGL